MDAASANQLAAIIMNRRIRLNSLFQQRIQHLANAPLNLLTNMRHGLEKESLRITPNGYLATTPHPVALGSNLTHPYITTDYSEALLEFITPAITSPTKTIEWLMDLHTYTYQQIGNELIWANSMPCTLTKEADIPIAQYGSSNLGQLKHIYRRGLCHRYGKAMQIIAGIHFNFSFSEEFWIFYKELLNDKQSMFDFVNEQYFNLIRNYWRYCWLLIILFGASPAVCQSFLQKPNADLKRLGPGTWYAPQGTSLRMSDMGYQNRRQHELEISYQSLAAYVADLKKAISIPEPEYLQYGSVAEGKNTQLNANLLQIEAEYYSPIRPKHRPQANIRPLTTLSQLGVEYIEVRVLDLNPYEPVGINVNEIHFLESFLMMCLLQPSPDFSATEHQDIKSNLRQAVYHGQDFTAPLHHQDKQVSTGEWAQELLQQIQVCAKLLDKDSAQTPYQNAVTSMQNKFSGKEKLLARQVIDDIEEFHEGSFTKFGCYWSQQHQKTFLERQLSPERQAEFDELAIRSIKEREALEKATL